MIKKYYQILELTEDATLADIKKAYRLRAKLLHPDVSSIPDAHVKFILLNEAYEYLQNLKTGKIYIPEAQTYSKAGRRYYTDEDWQQTEKEYARERARQHAQMEYESFIKTDFYKNSMAVSAIMDFISILAVLSIFITPIFGYYQKGLFGLIGGFIIIFITVHFWTDILIYNKTKHKFRDLLPSFLRILRTRTFKTVIGIALNLFLIFRIGFNTLVPLWTLAVTFIMVIVVTHFLLKNRFKKSLIPFATLTIAPRGSLTQYFFLIF